KPASFAPLQQRVLDSAGLHVVVPEYNGSFPGALKYFIDMWKYPDSFEHRPVTFVGIANGTWGALRAVEQLQLVFGYRNAHIYPDRVFIPTVKACLNADGHITDPKMDDRLDKQAAGFAAFAAKVG
ncbi:MAG TPA: NAD(P)H-dependent oxidoreductase, partial [Tepidisphaeraceae bacterium]|nr:NAD(P)H-dependent oxidoreductase [Tepidisphaeraceae bacterium]